MIKYHNLIERLKLSLLTVINRVAAYISKCRFLIGGRSWLFLVARVTCATSNSCYQK